MVDLNRVISSAVKSGKVLLGSKQAVAASKSGRAVALIVSLNCPTEILSMIRSSSKVPLYSYPASSIDLGVACGKRFPVAALTIREISEPEVLKMVQGSAEASESKGMQ